LLALGDSILSEDQIEPATGRWVDTDEGPLFLLVSVFWTKAGLFGDYVDGTRIRIARLGRRENVTPLNLGVYEVGDFHVSNSGHLESDG